MPRSLTDRLGRNRFPPGTLFLIGLISLLLLFLLLGSLLDVSSLDLYVHDMYLVVAHPHVLLLIVLTFGGFAVAYHVLFRIFRKSVNLLLAHIHFCTSLAGLCSLLLPYYLRAILESPEYSGWAGVLDAFTLAGVVIFLTGQLLFLLNIIQVLVRR